MNCKSKIKNHNLGFTVLETIVAIFIVSLSIAGATLAARGGINGGSIAKEEVRAFYLAQEAIEILANRKNSNELMALNGGAVNWLTGIADINNDPCALNKICRIQTSPEIFAPEVLVSCGTEWGSCSNLGQDLSNYINGYGNGYAGTRFKREIQVEKNLSNSNEIIVTVLISWNHGSQIKQFKTKTILTNWFRSVTD